MGESECNTEWYKVATRLHTVSHCAPIVGFGPSRVPDMTWFR